MESSSEDLDSLFEGMVLIDHSFPSSPPAPPPPTPAAAPAAATDEERPSTVSPLDENLFSDLTFFNPSTIPEDHNHQPQHDDAMIPSTPAPATAPHLPARQLSSRKKKRAAIRIGYGRAVADPEPPPSISPSSPQPALPVLSSIDVAPYSPSVEEEVVTHPSIESDVAADSHPSPAAVDSTPASQLQSMTDDPADPLIGKNSVVESEDEKYVRRSTPVVAHLDDGAEKSTQIGQEEKEKEIEKEVEATAPAEADDGSVDESKLDSIRALIAKKLEHVQEMAANGSTMRKEAARRRRKEVENLNSVSAKYKGLERQLEEACEAEDFEQAESLSESLAAAEREKEGFLNALRVAEADCDSMDTKMEEVLALQIAAEEEGVMMLNRFAKDAVDNADLILSNAKEFSSKQMEEWLSSIEALEIKRVELDIETHLISDARSGLKDSIDHSVGSDMKEKELLYKKGEILKNELDELLALVRLKEAEIAENSRNIEEIETRIIDVVSGFHDAQSNIDAKYDKLQSSISQIELEKEALSVKKKEIDEFLSQTEDKSSKLQDVATASSDEAKTRQEFVELRKNLAATFLKSRQNKVRLAKIEEEILDDVQNLRQQISAARASLQELSSTRASIHQGIDSSKQRILFIEKRGPELEAEKKVAAAARNFKEAGRIAAEAKALSTEKEDLQNKVEQDIFRLNELEEQMKETVKRLQDNEALISSREKEAAIARYERLQLVSAAAMAERSAALKLGDLEEANILLTEAESAKTEASRLQQAYKFETVEIEEGDFISMELIVNLSGKDLAEMAASVQPTAV